MMFDLHRGRCWTSLYIGGRKIDAVRDDRPVFRSCEIRFTRFRSWEQSERARSSAAYSPACSAGFVVWVVFSVVVRSEERLLLGIYGKEFEDYRAQVPRFFPNPRLWRDIPTILVMPSRMVRTFGDGMMFLLSVPLADLVERLQDAGLFPILFHIA